MTDMRFLSPDIALPHGHCVLHLPTQGGTIVDQPATQTIVALRQNDGWRFTAFQNTRIEPSE